MKKTLIILLLIAVCMSACSCSLFEPKAYTVALITSSAGITDRSASQGVYRGLSAYCEENGISFKEYVPADDSGENIESQIKDAASHGAELMIFAGEKMGAYADYAAKKYADLDILTVDCEPSSPTAHTHAVTFAIEQAAFLAGYAACSEGFVSLAFIAGERNERSETYFNGFIRGIEQFLTENPLIIPEIRCWYTGLTGPDKKLEDTAVEWFNSGTQVIFVCGDGLYRSLNYAANVSKKQLIGAGLSQAGFSERYITTAACEYQRAAEEELADYFKNGGWSAGKAGKTALLDISTDMVGLPNDYGSYRFKRFAAGAYETFYAKLKYGTLGVTVEKTLPEELHCAIQYLPDGMGTEDASAE